MGRHAKADFEAIYDHEWAKIDQSERPQAEHMLTYYFLKTKTAATAASLVRSCDRNAQKVESALLMPLTPCVSKTTPSAKEPSSVSCPLPIGSCA